MRLLLFPAAWAAILTLSSCAQEQPPAPAHPALEGDWESVSHADVRVAMNIIRKDLIKTQGSALPIYRVRVVDRNHIQVCYWPRRDIEACAQVERVNGTWRRSQFERAIITGRSVPTG